MTSQRDETVEDSDRPSARRYLLMFGTGGIVIAVLAVGVFFMLSGDKEPPRKVQELTVVTLVPPPPPPPPPPPEQKQEEQVVEQTPVKQEIIEEKPVHIPKDAPPDQSDEPLPGPPGLDDAGQGPGELLGRPGGKGFLGGGGGGGGGSRWGWYASIVQSQIEAALRANEKTRHAVLQIRIRLWSDAVGRISRVQLVSSTGDSALDAVLRDQVLTGLQLREPPPKDMPMPINLRVIARKPT
jgi:protein TonB